MTLTVIVDGPEPDSMLPLTRAIESYIAGASVRVERESYVLDSAEVTAFETFVDEDEDDETG